MAAQQFHQGQMAPVLDFEALSDQWRATEERDGIRLSWNTFPSSRMVYFYQLNVMFIYNINVNFDVGSF